MIRPPIVDRLAQLSQDVPDGADVNILAVLGIAEILRMQVKNDTLTNFELVQGFHKKLGLPLRYKPGLISLQAATDRVKHMDEELKELWVALEHNDTAKQLDALVDIAFLAMGFAVESGWAWDVAFMRVAVANMEKIRHLKLQNGKEGVVKPPGWQAPNLEDLVI